MENIYYSAVGIQAIVIFMVINYRFYINEYNKEETKEYRKFLDTIFCYFLTDIAWGVLSEIGNVTWLYIDTVAYYFFLALSLVFCCRYFVVFLDLKSFVSKMINVFAMTYASAMIVLLVVNHFYHVLFWFDEAGHYESFFLRDVALAVILLMLVFILIISWLKTKKNNRLLKRRILVFSLYVLFMSTALITQAMFPLLPFYTVGLTLGTLFINVFIHYEEEHVKLKEIAKLNTALQEEKKTLLQQKDEISTAFAIISGLSRDYHTIWVCEKKTMKMRMVSAPGKGVIMESLDRAMQYVDCDDSMKSYIDYYVCDEDKDRMRKMVNTKMVLEQLSKSDFYSVNYKRRRLDGKFDYNQMTFTNIEILGNKDHFVFGFRDVNDIVSQEMALRKEIDDARVAAEANIAANNAKTKFLQNMSHEIRTPLNAMYGFSQLLGMPDGSWTEEEKQQYNAYIYNSYRMLEMLISDILDIADSEHSNYRIELSDVNVNEVCRSSTMSVEFRVPVNVNLSFTTDLPDDYIVRSDSRRIQQVLINYLTNACKNTEKGEIHLHCSQTEHPGKITFSVTDTGKGIPADKAALIFNRFTKLDQFVQGSGLGLNICMTIADKLGGEVYLDTTYTNGARFVFVIDDKKE